MSTLKPQDFLYSAPLTVLIVVGLLLILVDAFTRGRQRQFIMQLTVAGCIMALVTTVFVGKKVGAGSLGVFGDMLIADRLGLYMVFLFTAVTLLTALISAGHQAVHDWESGEFYGLMVLSAAGMGILAMANDLVMVFLGLETMSLAVYSMIATRRGTRRGAEAALKYFLMGAFASGLLLYGIALLYGATGTTNLQLIADRAASVQQRGLLMASTVFLITAFGFKIALVPFHMWAPDAYEGAPSPVTAFMAAAVKAAAFAAIIRVFVTALGGDVLPFGRMGWATVFAVLAALTMTIGNIAALRQPNIKRMLAYSSIAHAGVLMVGVVAAGVEPGGAHTAGAIGSISSVLFYLAAYSITTLGAFAVIIYVGKRGNERVLVSDWHGLASHHPGAALAMTVFMLSLAGLPPTAGFVAKFAIFKSAIQAYDQQLLWLAVVGILNAVVSIFYYLRVVTAMYFRDAPGEFGLVRSSALTFTMAVAAILVMQMGLMPDRWFGYAGL